MARELEEFRDSPANGRFTNSPLLLIAAVAILSGLVVLLAAGSAEGSPQNRQPVVPRAGTTFRARPASFQSGTYQRRRIVGAARSQLGHKGGNKYTGGTGHKWCSEFASWVNHQAGNSFTGEDGWRLHDSKAIRSWFRTRGEWHDRGSGVIPQPGDTITFRHLLHTGIVVRVKGDRVFTIEGNHRGNNRVAAFSYRVHSRKIDGWGGPSLPPRRLP